MKPGTVILEACVETLEEAIRAEQKGAHRLELCSRLDQDGLTPCFELTQQVVEKVNIPVKVMIRPRAGNFIYSEGELRKMKQSIHFCKELGVRGVVFGILDEDNKLNLEQIRELSMLAYRLEVTIHKAIDQTPDLPKSVSQLIQLPAVTSILSSGGAITAVEGAGLLKKMMHIAESSLTIIPAGRITNKNISEIHHLIGAREYHGRKIVGNL